MSIVPELKIVCVSLIVLAGSACQDGRIDATEQRSSALTSAAINLTVTITTPRLVPASTVALGSTASMLIGAASKVTRPGTGFTLITNMGTAGVKAEPDALLGNVSSTSSVTLSDRVHAFGKVIAPSMVQGNGVLVDGGVDTTTALTPATITTWSVVYPSATVTDVILQNNANASPAPGRYGKFQVFPGSKLTLSTGKYYVDTFDLESGSSLILNQDAGPVVLYVRVSIIFLRGTLTTTSGAPSDLLLGYLATPDVFVEMPFTGTIVAPSAKLVLRPVTGGHVGAFFGKNVEVGPSTTVSFRPANNVFGAQPPAGFESCAAAIQPNDTLTGTAREVQYQKDILRFCTGVGIPACEQTLRARMNADFFMAAASIITGRMSTGSYQLVVTDREAKLATFRTNPTLACDVAAHDGDGDFVPDSADACKTTPLLTPVLANGCTNTVVPAGANISAVQNQMKYLGIDVDPRCATSPRPATPAPLGVFRNTTDPSLGKMIWLSKDPGVTTCPLYYQIEVQLTDGSPPRPLTFRDSETTTLPTWITAPAGAVQFNIHSTDAGNRGAWASYAVFTRTFRVRAFNFAGNGSDWSEWFIFGHQDCVAGQPCVDL